MKQGCAWCVKHSLSFYIVKFLANGLYNKRNVYQNSHIIVILVTFSYERHALTDMVLELGARSLDICHFPINEIQ